MIETVETIALYLCAMMAGYCASAVREDLRMSRLAGAVVVCPIFIAIVILTQLGKFVQ